MESQNQEIVASGSPAEVPNDPGKMFIGGLSWQTSPGEEDDKDTNFVEYFIGKLALAVTDYGSDASIAS